MRGIKVAIFEEYDYYLKKPMPYAVYSLSSVMLWSAGFIGAAAYTLTIYRWVDIVKFVTGRSCLLKIKKFLLAYIYLLILLSIIVPATGLLYGGTLSLLVMILLFVVTCIIETTGFIVLGFRVLRVFKKTSVLSVNQVS